MLVCSCYSYSDGVVYGSTSNAASNGYSWVMTNILPQQAGLTVGNVIYRYTTVKNPDDDMVVHVQNENARGDGYIFRSSDDWSGLSGNTINKAVPIDNIDISYWGNGSIEVDGTGVVTDPSVIYTYKYDPCFDPQTDPSCPGWIAPIDYSVVGGADFNPLDDTVVQDELDRKKIEKDEEEQEEADRKATLERKRKESGKSLEKVLGIVNTTLLATDAVAKHEMLIAMDYVPQSYYGTIPGGTYEDKPKIPDSTLPDSKKGLRVNLASQILHQKMVDLQYEK